MTRWRLQGEQIDDVLVQVGEAARAVSAVTGAERREVVIADVARGGPPAAGVAQAVGALLSTCAADVGALRQHVDDSSAAVAAARACYDAAQVEMQASTAARAPSAAGA